MKSTLIARQDVANSVRWVRSVKRPVARLAWLLTFAALSGLAAVTAPAAAQTFKVLYTFAGYPSDGAQPAGGLLMDAAGNLYGTTAYGGSHEGCPGKWQCGAVFKLDTNGAETVLYNFTGRDGANPISNLIMDANGDLYGTTAHGGDTGNCVYISNTGCGAVFKLSGTKETVLYRFTGGEDGAWPFGGVIMDVRGALYGTTNEGGAAGGGVAFKLVGKKETVLHSFTGGKDGNDVAGGLIMDAKGNLYGTDAFGGDIDCDYPNGCGVVFKLAGKQLTVLHSFKGPPDGQSPIAGLIMDASRNLYGTTFDGGTSGNGGTVFEVEASGKERVLRRFHPYTRGGFSPGTAVVQDASGNLYGTTEGAGGIAFEITVDGKEKVLHTFCTGDCSDGAYPNGLIMDSKGNLYGTAAAGGINGNGTVFMITP